MAIPRLPEVAQEHAAANGQGQQGDENRHIAHQAKQPKTAQDDRAAVICFHPRGRKEILPQPAKRQQHP